MINRIEIKERAKTSLGRSIFAEAFLMGVLVLFIASAISTAASTIAFVGTLLIMGPLAVGVASFFKNTFRYGKTGVEKLFDGFAKDFGGSLILGVVTSIFIFLWSLLFVIPGIVKAYSYSMAFYLKSEHADWDWKKCLDESVRMTRGHKLELFVLDLSFIGWYIVGALCLGIGELWAMAYHETAKLGYYEELSKITIE